MSRQVLPANLQKVHSIIHLLKYIVMSAEVQQTIISYLSEQLEITTKAIEPYDDVLTPEPDAEVRSMKVTELIRLRNRANDLSGYISVIRLLK
jgi:predicted transcriptional regulator